jgi:hypothetical protein
LFLYEDGLAMSNENKIYVKLQLEKNTSSGTIMITAHFDPDAPNYSADKNGYSWYPTAAEIDFLNEAFELIPKYKTSGEHFVNKRQEPLPQTKTPPKETPPTPPVRRTYEPEKTTPKYTNDEENQKTTKDTIQRIPLPPKPKTQKEELKEDTPKTEEAPFEPLDQDDILAEPEDDYPTKPELKTKEEQILVEADRKTIDEIVQRKTGISDDDDGLLVEADEKTIIDKVLRQKKKGKWQRT